jgi:hypothetical protein
VNNDSESIFAWLHSMPSPRPLVWQKHVFRRRIWYGLLCILLLFILVGLPILYGLQQVSSTNAPEKVKPTQIALYLGAIVVVAYVMFVLSVFKIYDDVKWLGQRGAIAEANLLAVLRGRKKLIVSYRFWDGEGRERERDATIDIERIHPVTDLAAGMNVPILYDPLKPEQRNYLWAEAANYLVEKLPSTNIRAD